MSKSQWILLILAAAVVAAYFGVLGHVVDALENKADVVEKKLDQKYDKQEGRIRAKLERLGSQPGIQQKFDTEAAWADALFVLAVFIFLTPIAAAMAIVVLMFLFSAIASLIPFVPHRVGVLSLAIVCAIAAYVASPKWVPYAEYYAGWVARAYLVITSSKA